MWHCRWLFVGLMHLIAVPVFAQATQPNDTARRSKVVYAAAGGLTVTVAEVEDAIQRLSPSERPTNSELRVFAQRVLDDKLLAQHARIKGFQNRPVVRRHVKDRLVQTLLLRAIDQPLYTAPITDAEVRRVYETSPDAYGQAEMRRACHILLPDRAKAQALLSEAKKADMHGFQELAKKHSIDQHTNLRGGDLGYFAREVKAEKESVEQSLREAAFVLRLVGEVHPRPIKAGSGWAILKLTGLRPAHAHNLQAASPLIRRRLLQERRETAIEALFGKLEAKYRPHVEADF